MQWKDTLIGAVLTLAVTTAGGIAVYYFTKEPEYKAKEILTYSIGSTGEFSGEKERVAFASVAISNRGGKAANSVVANIKFDGSAIKDLTTVLVPGIVEKRSLSKNGATLAYERLLPGETVTVNVLLDAPSKPVVSIRSDETLGSIENRDSTAANTKRKDVNDLSAVLVPASAIFLAAMFPFLFRWTRKLNGMTSTDRNNAAFLLLHNGLVMDAERILRSAVEAGRYDAIVLSNLALCNGLSGDHTRASALFDAAEFMQPKGHAAAVVGFNRSVILLNAGKRAQAIAELRKAISLSPKDLKRYCRLSVHLKHEMETQEFKDLLGGKN
ncbi:hypothetical protein PWP89_08090 [Stenotrophomonas rhizophila]|uniref:tetratricopeptide repeat protein n=1 Tax=Stenotrophomonas rhizophila TaxID=216778 RepID=UPI00117F98D6|nr:hypothetical protein [Stenotrophomonas rhizophila]